MSQENPQREDAANARPGEGMGGGPAPVFITGGNHVIYQIVLPPGPEREALLAQLASGQFKHEVAPGLAPLPALELRLAYADLQRREWRVVARQPGELPALSESTVPSPITQTPGFAKALETFQDLATRTLENKSEEAALHHAAALLGDALAAVLPEAERARLAKLGRGDGLPPFLIIESTEESILSLPWELLRLEGAYPVKEGRLDVARCFPNEHGATLAPPTGPLHLLLHVSAPADSGLRYEVESHRIYRAVREHARVTVNDMGEVHDLVAHLAAEQPANAVHFSGHGGAGCLQFEDEFGDHHNLKATDFLSAARAARPKYWPKLFYLGCCHGQTPVAHGPAVAQITATIAPPAPLQPSTFRPPSHLHRRTAPSRRLRASRRPLRPGL